MAAGAARASALDAISRCWRAAAPDFLAGSRLRSLVSDAVFFWGFWGERVGSTWRDWYIGVFNGMVVDGSFGCLVVVGS